MNINERIEAIKDKYELDDLQVGKNTHYFDSKKGLYEDEIVALGRDITALQELMREEGVTDKDIIKHRIDGIREKYDLDHVEVDARSIYLHFERSLGKDEFNSLVADLESLQRGISFLEASIYGH